MPYLVSALFPVPVPVPVPIPVAVPVPVLVLVPLAHVPARVPALELDQLDVRQLPRPEPPPRLVDQLFPPQSVRIRKVLAGWKLQRLVVFCFRNLEGFREVARQRDPAPPARDHYHQLEGLFQI